MNRHQPLFMGEYMPEDVYGDAQNGVTVILPDDWDNESSYIACDYMSCSQNEALFGRALFFIKSALVKVTHSYYAFPFVLFMLPLVIGLFFGISLGRKSQRKNEQEPFYGMKWITRFLTKFFRLRVFKFSSSFKDEESTDASSNPIPAVNMKNTATITEHRRFAERENEARNSLLKSAGATFHIPFSAELLPRHIAVVMDGNRRYGREKYGNATAGHWDGCRKLLEMASWCQVLGIPVLTVYAFSTENWNRSEEEVLSLFGIFCRYADELRVESIKKKIGVKVLSTNYRDKIPQAAHQALTRLEDETSCFLKEGCLQINVCLSYGSRGEIVNACQSLAQECIEKSCDPEQFITEARLSEEMLTSSDPDILIRTSGEIRLSNFLLWQLAYTELFFVDKMWPGFEKGDFLEILQSYAKGRQRRFGK